LSWSEAKAGGRLETPGSNLVLHEFAHQLDMMNGQVCDGTPQLATKEQLKEWIRVLEPEFNQLVKVCQRGHHGFIDCYGATSPAEFFAVITETWFERPLPLKLHHAEAYRVLEQFYGLNPAAWAVFEPVEHE
jgi:Mlc titration factor MtfA (ptsG expression regulator)